MSRKFTPTGNKEYDEMVKRAMEEDPNYVPPEPKFQNEPKQSQPNNIHQLREPQLKIEPVDPLTFDQLIKDIPKPIEYVLYPCLPTQGIGFIYAKTGLGKTLFTLNLAYIIAQGGSFLKYKCPKPRKVLYIDGEMQYNQIHSRLMAIAKFHGDLDFPKNFSIQTPDKLPFSTPQIDVFNGQVFYEELIERYQYEVIVFDNLSVLTSFDENKSAEWKPIQDWILKLRSKGKTVIIVHHSGKNLNDKTYRGTSKMIDCADVAISLQPVREEGTDEDNPTAKQFKVVYQKSRIFGGSDANSFEVNLTNGMWSHKSLNFTNLDKVVERLNIDMSQAEIAREMGWSRPYVNKLVKEARLTGLTSK